LLQESLLLAQSLASYFRQRFVFEDKIDTNPYLSFLSPNQERYNPEYFGLVPVYGTPSNQIHVNYPSAPRLDASLVEFQIVGYEVYIEVLVSQLTPSLDTRNLNLLVVIPGHKLEYQSNTLPALLSGSPQSLKLKFELNSHTFVINPTLDIAIFLVWMHAKGYEPIYDFFVQRVAWKHLNIRAHLTVQIQKIPVFPSTSKVILIAEPTKSSAWMASLPILLSSIYKLGPSIKSLEDENWVIFTDNQTKRITLTNIGDSHACIIFETISDQSIFILLGNLSTALPDYVRMEVNWNDELELKIKNALINLRREISDTIELTENLLKKEGFGKGDEKFKEWIKNYQKRSQDILVDQMNTDQAILALVH